MVLLSVKLLLAFSICYVGIPKVNAMTADTDDILRAGIILTIGGAVGLVISPKLGGVFLLAGILLWLHGDRRANK